MPTNKTTKISFDAELEQTVHDVFQEIDKNRDGRLDQQEIAAALRRLGIPSAQEQAAKLIALWDKDADGTIDYDNFLEFVRSNVAELYEVFDHIDSNNDGYLDVEEVKKTIASLYGMDLSSEVIQQFISKFDYTKDGLISRDEWMRGLIMLPFDSRNDTLDNVKQLFDFWRTTNSYLDFGINGLEVPQETKPKDKQANWIKLLLSGGAAGAVSRTATAPLDRLKTLLQLNSSKKSDGIITIMRNLYKEQGLLSMWRGNGANCVKIVPETACKFFAFEQYKRLISGTDSGEVTPIQRLLAGSLAGATAQTLIYPLEVVKTRLAGSPPGTPGYGGITETLSTCIRTNGVRSLYQGLSASLLGILPYAGIDLAVYETLKSEYVRYVRYKAGDKNMQVEIGTFVPLCCGMISSSVAQFISYPLNLVRTRLQMQGLKVGTSNMEYNGIIDVFTKTVKNEGVRGLYKGIGPNFMKVIPAVSISYAVFENVKKFLE